MITKNALRILCVQSAARCLAIVLLCSSLSRAQSAIDLIAGDAAADDNFGKAVAIDGEVAVAGAPGDDDRGEDTGAVYVFVRSDSGWRQQAKLISGDARAPKQFGRSVGISGNTIIVGAAGIAYVYLNTGTAWQLQAKLVPDSNAGVMNFGVQVAMSGDYAIVGADGEGRVTGSVFIFHRAGSEWQHQAKFMGVNVNLFGAAVDIHGAYAIVGEKKNHEKDRSAGAAYFFKRTGTVWYLEAKVFASDPFDRDRFGCAVAIHGDLALIGAEYDRNAGTSSGSVYVFQREGITWRQVDKLTSRDGIMWAQFGVAVDVYGDYAVVGASGDDARSINSGAVFVFHRTDTGWMQIGKLVAASTRRRDRFGTSVALSQTLVMAGSPFSDFASNNAGLASIHDLTALGCEGLAFPDSTSRGNLPGFDGAPSDQISYCFDGKYGDMYLGFEAYDVDGQDEVEVLLNGAKILNVPVTANNQWGPVQYALLSEARVTAGAVNQIVFDHRANPIASEIWGIKNAHIDNCYVLPNAYAFGKISGGDQQHADKVTFLFVGQPGELYLSFRRYSVNAGEVVIRLNGVQIAEVPPDSSNTWSETLRILLPDTLTNDDSYNLLVFDNVFNPPDALEWGVRAISVDNCVPLSEQAPKGLLPDSGSIHLKEVCYQLPGRPGETYLLYEIFDVDQPGEVQILLNDEVVHSVARTADLQWSQTRTILLSDQKLADAGTNRLVFRNTGNYHEGRRDFWGVRHVRLAQSLSFPFLEEAGSNTGHHNEVVFNFDGRPGPFYLHFKAFDIDDGNEVDLRLNGIKIQDLAATIAGQWSGSRELLLPDSLIILANHPNTLVFDNTANPPAQRQWGIRDVALDSFPPLPFFESAGGGTVVGFGFMGAPGPFILRYQVLSEDSAHVLSVQINDLEVGRGSGVDRGWSNDRVLLVDDPAIEDNGLNRLRFLAVNDQLQGADWKVRNVVLSKSLPLPHVAGVGKIHHGDAKHKYQAGFVFEGEPGDFELSFQAYDIDHSGEVALLVNGAQISRLHPGPNRTWNETETMFLPDEFVHDTGSNAITFVVTPNPENPFWWGVRNLHAERGSGSTTVVHRQFITAPGTITFEFPSASPFDYVYLMPEDGARHFFTYRLEVSSEGEHYTLLAKETSRPVHGSILLNVPETRTRFLRITGNSLEAPVDSLQQLGLDEKNYWSLLDSLLAHAVRAPLRLHEIKLLHRSRATAVETAAGGLPHDYELHQNHPNPFNPLTSIRFELPRPEHVTLMIYDLHGQLVEIPVNQKMKAGSHAVKVDASRWASGIYLCRLQAGTFTATRKMVLVK